MTYTYAIKELLKKAGDELIYPVNICINSFSANYIQFELDDGLKINEILNNKMENTNDISIQWLDNQNKINSISLYDYGITKFSNSNDELTKKSFNNEQHIKIDENGKYRLLLYPLEEKIEIEENGFVKQKILDFDKHTYQLEHIPVPKFDDYRYQSLYIYDSEEAFINAILLQFIIRQINHNNLAPDKIEISLKKEENITEEELDFIELIEYQKIENEINIKLKNIFGLTYEEINKLKFIYNKNYFEYLQKNNIVIELKFVPPHLKTIEINLMDSKEKLIKQIEILKDNFDKKAEFCLNLKERVSEEYLVKANEVLGKFPKSFEKKKDDLIKALFIFDYIQAKKLDIDRLNKEAQEENEMTQNKKEKDLELINYPKMNPSHSESIFYEIGKRIQEKAGQAKKIHNHIHKFLEQKF